MTNYVIKDRKGNIIRNKLDNTILMFDYHIQADNYIFKRLGNSPYLKVSKWKNKKVK